ncbi:MAG: signal transduction histidine kinase/CheY-like chemotaxis protein [Myxococcota bacterium]|jgi:signal transduction histidine kinase/CheY-like chemotaxis protein
MASTSIDAQHSSSSPVGLSGMTVADPPMLVRTVVAGGFARGNAAFHAQVGYAAPELADEPFIHWIVPADRPVFQAAIENGSRRCRVRHRTQDGGLLALDVQMAEQPEGTVILARANMSAGPTVPENSGEGTTFSSTLAVIAHIVEEQNPGFRCSILLVADGCLVRGAGPSLPEEYNAAIDGSAIGPNVGSCGTAIFWNTPVVVADIQFDPLWTPFAELAERAGVAACWSHPFVSTSGSVLGTLALYSPTPRAPTTEQMERLRAAARLTGLAVERGRAEEALRDQRARQLELESQLVQAAKMEALGVLAGGVAHDFNNVLATILANAEFAQELLPADSEVSEMLEDIIDASRRAGEFCQQMLTYAGRGSHKTSRIELAALLSELRVLVRSSVSKKTTLDYSIPEGAIFVEGDENQLLQVVMNLVVNAADALGNDEGRIVVGLEQVRYDATALLELSPNHELSPGQYVHLTVTDNGPGMDSSTMERIFDPFFTTKFSGHGLGLAAAQGIVAKHGGVIQLESELGEGTKFTLVLPTVGGSSASEAAPDSPVVAAAPARILVVDDEDGLRSILVRRLKHSGYDVLEAADGQEAIDIFRRHSSSIACVLLDFAMPKKTGYEVYQELRLVQPDVRAILMSGFSHEEIVRQFAGADIAGFLQKPISADHLAAALAKAMPTATNGTAAAHSQAQ